MKESLEVSISGLFCGKEGNIEGCGRWTSDPTWCGAPDGVGFWNGGVFGTCHCQGLRPLTGHTVRQPRQWLKTLMVVDYGTKENQIIHVNFPTYSIRSPNISTKNTTAMVHYSSDRLSENTLIVKIISEEL